MSNWVYQHYKIITGILVPIIVAMISIIKIAPIKKNKSDIKGNNNTQFQDAKDIENNQGLNRNVLNAAPNATQNLVNGNQNQTINNNADIKGVEAIARGYICTKFPQTEKALNKLRLNAFEFLNILESHFKELSKEELEKFSEPDVQIALQNSIKGAARKDSTDVHRLLARLITDRVQKTSSSITELAVNEAIEVASKLDANLIKILSLSFMFSRTKYLNLTHESHLFQRLSLAKKEFENIDISISKFEYLEAVSCGKLLNFTNNERLVDIISRAYPHLFLKEIPIEQVEALNLPLNIKSMTFSNSNYSTVKLNPVVGTHVFEDQQLMSATNSIVKPFVIENNIKEKLKTICGNHRLSASEIESMLCKNIPSFKVMINMWDKGDFTKFSLTAAGIAIGRAYLEQAGFGNYDISLWVN